MYPILFSIGSIRIYSYGLMLAIAFLLAYYATSKRAALFHISEEIVANLTFLLLIFGIIGARLLYVLMNIGYFMVRPLNIFLIYKGGLVFYGGFILAFIAGAVFAKVNGLSILNTADLIAPFIPLCHAIGRIGCFLNGCCYGRPTYSPLGISFPGSGVKLWPTQLFSSAGLFIIFLILLYLQKKRGFKGQIITLYIIIYGIFRFFIDFLRGDLAPVFYGLTTTQLISAGFVIAGLLFYAWSKKSA